MPQSRDEAADLDFWLRYIASVHPREIELGLERIRAVAKRMGLSKPARQVIVVAGSNGKGSCVCCLEAVLQSCGYRTASYTSPHLHRFNERIRIEKNEVDDRQLCDAFAAVEGSRGEHSLSYFEFATLAALWLFNRASLDVAILEVGLGGRLDAVNIIDADVSIITNISLDHQDWLGSDLESIGAEKAGVIRAGTPILYGDDSPLRNILQKATRLGAPLYRIGVDCQSTLQADATCWTFSGRDANGQPVLASDLPLPGIPLPNAVLALQALALLLPAWDVAAIRAALQGLTLAGRFELRTDRETGRNVVFDVAHNPAATGLLARKLHQYRTTIPGIGQIAAVIAVMADKDIEGMAQSLESCLDICYIAQVEEPRCMPADVAFSRLESCDGKLALQQLENAVDAYRAACRNAAAEDLVVITGSFYTVAATRQLSKPSRAA